jgi:pilus assembly protein CpaB
MNGKSIMILGLAIVCGLGAMFGTNRLLSNNKTQTTSDLQDVLVAARDLRVEEVLKPELVKIVQRAKSDVPPGAFTSFKDVEDRWVLIKTLEDEPILDRKLAEKGTPAGLVARIPKGMRAFAVEVTEQSGVSGFILPDHRVDVVQIDSTTGGRTDAETILQDVLVLASGQTFTRPEDRSIIARTITLAVTPDQVHVLVAAKQKGPLTLSLRGLNDRSQVESKKVAAQKAAAQNKQPAAPAPPPPPPPPPPAESAVVAENADAREPAAARYLTIYKGLERDRRVMLNRPNNSEPEPEDSAPAGGP